MQSVIRSVQYHGSFVGSVVQHNFERPMRRNQELMTLFMRVCSSRLTSRNIIEIKHSGNVKRNIHRRPLHRRNITSLVFDLRQLYYRTIIDGTILISHFFLWF